MKKIIFAVSCLLSGLSYGQISTDTVNINQHVYDPVEIESYIKSLKKMTKKEKERFKSTFIHQRGQFKIPERPLVDPSEK